MEKAEEAILSLELNPSHARGLNTLGTIQARQDKMDDARTSQQKLNQVGRSSAEYSN